MIPWTLELHYDTGRLGPPAQYGRGVTPVSPSPRLAGPGAGLSTRALGRRDLPVNPRPTSRKGSEDSESESRLWIHGSLRSLTDQRLPRLRITDSDTMARLVPAGARRAAAVTRRRAAANCPGGDPPSAYRLYGPGGPGKTWSQTSGVSAPWAPSGRIRPRPPRASQGVRVSGQAGRAGRCAGGGGG